MNSGACSAYFDRLKSLYAAMDNAYNAVAAQYGLTCDQCPDNCCRTRFYNHTYIEYYYLMAGIGTMPADQQQRIREGALMVSGQMAADEAAGHTPRRMCPLNVEGRCGLHTHRLMICRLHGIPHEIHFPDGRVTYGQGCSVFGARSLNQSYIPFDRTLFYQELSALEREFRQAAGIKIEKRLNMTIAQMIACGP